MNKNDPSVGWQKRLTSAKLQAAFFSMKFPEIHKDQIENIMQDFQIVDTRGKGELQEDEALRLLERRKETRTYVELRRMVKDIEPDRTRLFSLLEFLCAYYGKSWRVLHAPTANQEEIDRAIANLKEAEEKERLAAEESQKKEQARKQKEEEKLNIIEQERIRRENLEREERESQERKQRETSASGVKGMAAKFKYAGEDTKDSTSSNEDRIKAEAAARRAAKQKENERREAEEQERYALELKKKSGRR